MDSVEQLNDTELTEGYFQQDDAACRTSDALVALIISFFKDWNVSK